MHVAQKVQNYPPPILLKCIDSALSVIMGCAADRQLLGSLVYGRIVECMFVCESGNVLIICNIGAHCFEDHLKTALNS